MDLRPEIVKARPEGNGPSSCRLDRIYFTVMSKPNMRSVDVGVKSIFFEMP
jgi:hypothetical protein